MTLLDRELEQLSGVELTLIGMFLERGFGVDIPISVIHSSMYRGEPVSPQRQQQRIGATISRINSKIEWHRILPGKLKRTYRLVQFVDHSANA